MSFLYVCVVQIIFIKLLFKPNQSRCGGWGGVGKVSAVRRVGQQLPLEGVDNFYCR